MLKHTIFIRRGLIFKSLIAANFLDTIFLYNYEMSLDSK